MSPSIRPYQPSDRPAVEAICIATGLRGQLDFVEPERFARLWLNPYLVGEPEHCWVAEHEGRVVGYLVASLRPCFGLRALVCNLRPLAGLAWRWLAGVYRAHPPSHQLATWLLARSWRETPPSPAGFAHLHFNLAEGYRGGDLGQRLLARFVASCRAAGLPGYYGILFTGGGKRPAKLYERLGYELHASRPCSLFTGQEVQLTCIKRDFAEVPHASLGGHPCLQ